MTLHGKAVVRVYLYGEILSRVDEFYEEREFVSETFVDLLSHEFPFVFVYKLNEVQAHIDIVGNATINGYALMSRYATNLPRFSDIRLGGVDFLEWCYLISSLDGGFQIRFKFVRFHACILFRFFFYKNTNKAGYLLTFSCESIPLDFLKDILLCQLAFYCLCVCSRDRDLLLYPEEL